MVEIGDKVRWKLDDGRYLLKDHVYTVAKLEGGVFFWLESADGPDKDLPQALGPWAFTSYCFTIEGR